MKGIAESYNAHDLEVLWVGIQDRKHKIIDMSERHKLSPVGFDPSCTIASKFNINYGAGLLFVDHDGTISGYLDRGFTEAQVHEEIQKMI